MARGAGPVDVEALLSRARSVSERRVGSWVARGVKVLSYYAGLRPNFSAPGAREGAILFYHKVERRPFDAWGSRVLDGAEFDRQMGFLAREYHPVSLSALLAGLKGERPLESRAVAVTFDDGYRNNFHLAAPILRKHRVPATFFLATGLIGTHRWMWAYELEAMFRTYPLEAIRAAAHHPLMARICALEPHRRTALNACVQALKDGPHDELLETMAKLRARLPVEQDEENRFMSWDEVRALFRQGFDVGAHTVEHPILPRLSLPEVDPELTLGRDRIAQELGKAPTLFAYPNGETRPPVTARVARYFEGAVTTRRALCSPFDSPWELPRIGAPLTVSELAFELARLSLQPVQLGT